MKTVLGVLALGATLATPTMAADMRMPVKAPPAPVITLYSWTGCYIGGHVGFGWGQRETTLVPNTLGIDFDHDADGVVAGGQIGCNLWQNDRWVFGIEGQAGWADIDGDRPFDPAIIGSGFRSEIDIVGSIAARLGYAFGATGQTLGYIKGGAAFASHKFVNTSPPPAIDFESDRELRWGWMVGAGFEQALGSNWSVKAEYNFSHFGDRDLTLCTVGAACVNFETGGHLHLVKVGLNYRFGGWGGAPVAARY
jgi:outer membrane immunogenic protein